MAADHELGIARETPGVFGGAERDLAAAIGLAHDLVEDADREGGDAVSLEILELVVAPDENEIGAEGVERLAQPRVSRHQAGFVHARSALALVIAPLDAHRLGPARLVLIETGL